MAKLKEYADRIADRLKTVGVDRMRSERFSTRLKALRNRLGLTQEAFATTYDIPIANVRNWEQESRGTKPDAAARLLLDMIDAEPEKMAKIVEQARARSPLPV